MKWDHGGAITGVTIDFSVSLNPLGPPDCVAELLQEALPLITRYPSLDAAPARRSLAAFLGLDPGEVLVGNGATELIGLLVRALRPGRVWVIEPCYSEYRGAAEACGLPVAAAPSRVVDGRFEPLWEALAPEPGDVVFIGYPNNPTGQLPPRDALERLRKTRPGVYWVFDESFLAFVDPAKGSSPVLPPVPGVAAVCSLTKFYAVPGLRLGYLVGTGDLVRRLLAAKDPWSVNGLGEHLVGRLLAETAYAVETRAFVTAERARVTAALERLGLRVFSGEANFLLCALPDGYEVQALNACLLRHGMAVRNASTFAGLSARHFRMGLRRADENDRLLEVLSGFLQGGKR
ncbi:pyridoxal phosphate-dependent aminotransferase [Desulforudis sp. 1088]|uniref:pyridoxal phosphate-dependent aminotransferase n=1 Tax=unclassified Candidatus Desulforudis TaxID=2635950 RepID=UPI003CE4FBAA